MKRMLSLFLCMCILSAALPLTARAETGCSAAGCILLHPETGTVLYEHCADQAMPMASTTKLMTALVTLEHAELSEPVQITAEMTGVEGSSMYLCAGETYTVEELLCGLLLVSGNDAAAALADHVGGDMAGFARLMNERAERLGLKNTHFVNAHGLDAPGHYSCARDLAIIMAECLTHPEFCAISGKRTARCHERTLVNHNKLLWSCPGMLAGKTGYTMASGRSLVTACERDGMLLVCVTINDRDDWNDHTALYDWAEQTYKCLRRMMGEPAGAVPVISGTGETVTAVYAQDFVLLKKADEDVQNELCLPQFVFAGGQAGDEAGTEIIRVGDTVYTLPLVWGADAPVDGTQRLSRWEQFKRVWYMACRYSGVWYLPC